MRTGPRVSVQLHPDRLLGTGRLAAPSLQGGPDGTTLLGLTARRRSRALRTPRGSVASQAPVAARPRWRGPHAGSYAHAEASPDPERSAVIGTTDQRLRRLVEMGITLGSELSLDDLLQRLVETAAELTGARYAALGVI